MIGCPVYDIIHPNVSQPLGVSQLLEMKDLKSYLNHFQYWFFVHK